MTLKVKDKKLSEVIEIVEAKTGFNFFFKSGTKELNKLVSVDLKDKPIERVLDQILDGTSLSYRVMDNYVAIVKAEKKQEENASEEVEVKGNVTDTKGDPIPSVSIVIKGTVKGIITDLNGNFTLDANQGDVLVFSFIGFNSQEVVVNGNEPLKIVLQEEMLEVGEVVVTALGIKREKKILGYAMQEVKGEVLNETGDAVVTSALAGKVAGVQISSASTGLGGSTKITIRGNSSLSGSNEPLWIVDGVPFNDNQEGSASAWGGIDRGGAALDLNPEDIESISVLKGPNAAALYGSRAGNGVILVTTKRGSKKDGFATTYNGSVTFSDVTETLDIQQKYGQGSQGLYLKDDRYCWGSELDGSQKEAWNGETIPYSFNGNKMEDYFRTGVSQSHSVSVGKSNETSNFRASIANTKDIGIFDKQSMNKINFDIKSGMEINKILSLDSKISLSQTDAKNRPVFGKPGEVYQLLYVPTNVRLDDMKQFSAENKPHVNWYGPDTEIKNPYYIRNQYQNSDSRLRAFGYFNVKLKLADWLNFSAKQAFDVHQTHIDERNIGDALGITDLKDEVNDSYNLSEVNFREFNSEALLMGDKRFEKWHVGFTFGTNRMYTKSQWLRGSTQNRNKEKGMMGLWNIQAASDLSLSYPSADYKEKEVQSVFGTTQFTYNDFVTLDLTARNDWSSALPAENRAYFYPSVNLSFILTEYLRKLNVEAPSWITFAKLRGSWAKVGKDCSAQSLRAYKNSGFAQGKFIWVLPEVKPNPNLKPEISRSYEFGGDFKFLNNRIGLDFTYYNSETENQIMEIPTKSLSSGYKRETINAGLIINKGYEVMLYSTPFKTDDFEFNVDVNFSKNTTNVEKLHESLPDGRFEFSGDKEFFLRVTAENGEKLGNIEAETTYKRNDKGQIVVGADGLPLKVQKSHVIGNIQPDWTGSLKGSLRYKRFRLSALFDVKHGGDLVSVSEAVATMNGISKRTENREDIVVEGVSENGDKNTTKVSAEDFNKCIGGMHGFAEEFLYDASYVKFKELSISYSFSGAVLSNTPFEKVRVSLVGRNLGYLHKNTPGTSPEAGYDRSIFSQAVDFSSVPFTRTLGFSLGLSF